MAKKEIKVPSPGESVFEVTVGSIKRGQVNKGEIIVVFETDKAALELAAEESGVVSWTVKEGDSIKVGAVIGHIEVGVGAGPAEKPAEKAVEKPVEKKVEVVSQPTAPAILSGGGMRKTADDFVADLQEKPETFKEVVVSREATEKRERMPKIRKVIAERLVQVKNETAMLSTFNEVDLSAVMAIRNREKDAFEKKHGVKLGFMSFFVKACVAALKEFPHVHARIEGDEIVTPLQYNIAVAVGTDKGLFVPVLKNCEELSFAAIEKEIKYFGTKAKEGKILPDDMRGGSFTITNGGVYGSLLSTPIINPPQSAILGMHAIKNRPIDVEGVVALRPMMYLALSYDHRIIDGKAAVGFLVHVKETLEHPDHFFLDL